MSPELLDQPREYNELSVRRFLQLLSESTQLDLSIQKDEEWDAAQTILETYQDLPPEGEEYAELKVSAAREMLTNQSQMSDRKRLQVVRGLAHKYLQQKIMQAGGPNPYLSNEDFQIKVDELTISLRPHQILKQVADNFSRIHDKRESENIEIYPEGSVAKAQYQLRDSILVLKEEDRITPKTAAGLLLLFGVENYSKEPGQKSGQKVMVVQAKALFIERLANAPVSPLFSRMRDFAGVDSRKEIGVPEKLGYMYSMYARLANIDTDEARRRFMIDSRFALTQLFSSDE